MEMIKFECDAFRPVYAETFKDAARVFAERYARKHFGRNSGVGALRCESQRADNSAQTWNAFVGHKKGSYTIGHNTHFLIKKG